jgi:hypothetical protein
MMIGGDRMPVRPSYHSARTVITFPTDQTERADRSLVRDDVVEIAHAEVLRMSIRVIRTVGRATVRSDARSI